MVNTRSEAIFLILKWKRYVLLRLKDAVVIGTFRLPAGDPYLRKLHEELATNSEKSQNFETAAQVKYYTSNITFSIWYHCNNFTKSVTLLNYYGPCNEKSIN